LGRNVEPPGERIKKGTAVPKKVDSTYRKKEKESGIFQKKGGRKSSRGGKATNARKS